MNTWLPSRQAAGQQRIACRYLITIVGRSQILNGLAGRITFGIHGFKVRRGAGSKLGLRAMLAVFMLRIYCTIEVDMCQAL